MTTNGKLSLMSSDVFMDALPISSDGIGTDDTCQLLHMYADLLDLAVSTYYQTAIIEGTVTVTGITLDVFMVRDE